MKTANFNRAKYRKEYFTFKTNKGFEKKAVVVLAGENERQKLLDKAAQMEKTFGWKLV